MGSQRVGHDRDGTTADDETQSLPNTGASGLWNLLPWWLRRQRICLQCGRPRFDPWAGKIPWRRERQPTPVFLPGEFHGERNLAGYSPWGRRELDKTDVLVQHLHSFTLAAQSCVLVHQLWSSWNPILWGCMDVSLHRHDWWNPWSLAFDLNL